MNRIISALLFSIFAVSALPAQAADAPQGEASAQAGKVQLADNAPDSYTVVKGDTLWGISGKFLKQPWRWPEVWRLNREQIRNPNLIYPGQVIVLDRNGPYLKLGNQVGDSKSGYEKLSPQVYATPTKSPIASVPMDLIRPFLVEPLVEEYPSPVNPPAIVGIQEDRVLAGAGDTVFAKNLQSGVDQWQIYRRAQPIKDPVTGEVLAYEALLEASAQVTTAGTNDTAAALRVTDSRNEVSIGDRLVPAAKEEILTAVPHSAPESVQGRVVGVVGGLEETGRMGVITLGVGKREGVEPGHVFALHRNRGAVKYDMDGQKEVWKLPDERYGLVFVFRVFNRVSYGLVLDSNLPVKVGDDVRAP